MIALLKLVPLWAWLSLALIASVVLNLRQWSDGRMADAEQEHALQMAVLNGRVAALAERADALDLQGRQLATDAQALLDSLGVIHEQEQTQLSTWRGFVRRLPPLPTGCGPGPERVDGFNSVMRDDP